MSLAKVSWRLWVTLHAMNSLAGPAFIFIFSVVTDMTDFYKYYHWHNKSVDNGEEMEKNI